MVPRCGGVTAELRMTARVENDSRTYFLFDTYFRIIYILYQGSYLCMYTVFQAAPCAYAELHSDVYKWTGG